MNVLFAGVLPPHPGGAAVSCGQLLTILAGLGHRVRAVAPMVAEGHRDGDAFARSHPEIEIHRFPVPHFETDTTRVPNAAHRALEVRHVEERVDHLMGREAPDLVLLGRESFAWLAARLTARAAVPCVLRVGGTLLRALAADAYPRELAAPYVDGCRSADLVIVQAVHMRELAERLGVRRVAVVPNSVDLEQFAPRSSPAPLRAALGIGKDDVVVVHASNLKAVKRPLDVVQMAGRVLARDPRLVFVIVGDGACRAAMEDLCRRTGVSDRFRFVGWVDYARMPDHLALADMVVMPSEFEQQARVYLETQATGRVLVASAVRSARDLVLHGRTGLLYRPGDVDDLAAQVLRAAADPALRASIGRAARESVACHDLADIGPQFAATLERVLHGRMAAAGVAARRAG